MVSGVKDLVRLCVASILLASSSVAPAASTHSVVDGCKDLGKAESAQVLPHLKRVFREMGLYPIERMDISPGRDCGDAIYFLFEAKLVYRPGGLNWIVSQDKQTRKVTIQQGI